MQRSSAVKRQISKLGMLDYVEDHTNMTTLVGDSANVCDLANLRRVFFFFVFLLLSPGVSVKCDYVRLYNVMWA